MADPYPESGGFPDQHTTSTYTTTTQQAAAPAVQCTIDKGYPVSLPGILKIVQMVLGFLYWTVIASYYYHFSGHGWLLTVGICAWVFTTIFFFLYLFALTKRVTIINWPLTELLNNALWCVFYLTAAILVSVRAGQHSRYIEHGKLVWGSLCCWALFILYGVTAFLNFREFQALGGISTIRLPGQAATTTTSTHTTTTVISTSGNVDEKAQAPPPYPGGPFT